MWNQLIVDPTLDKSEQFDLDKQLNELKQDCNTYFSNKSKEVKNLIEFNEGLFVWNPLKEVLCYLLIKNSNEVVLFQTMILKHSSLSDIFSIKLSLKQNKYFLLSGKNALEIIELPQKYGTQFAYEGGKSSFLVKSWNILERLFVCNEKIKLLESCWHPGSLNDDHIVILTNDNYLRIINIFEPSIALEKIRLISSNDSFSDYSYSLFASSLGETAVSFCFGSPVVKSNEKNFEKNDVDEKKHIKKVNIKKAYWPIYILKGNGEILLIYSNLEITYISKKVYGPLKMLPAAEDNYGVDFCSIIVMNTNPSLLVMATSTGIIYHCLILEDDDEKNNFFLNFKLYVYESIELTLSLTASIQLENICHIKLQKCKTNNDRYFCVHLAGIHVINVPFINQLFINDFNSVELDETIVEHLICTRPIATTNDNENFIPSGLSLTFQKGYLLSILLSSGEIIFQKLSNVNFVKRENIFSNNENSKSEDIMFKSINFYEKIIKLLQKESNTPLIKSKSSSIKFKPKEALQFILNTTEILKKEYLVKFDLVSELIEKRSQVLLKEKEAQSNDLDRMLEETKFLINKIENLTKKYDSTLLKQEDLSNKIEKIIDKLMRKQPQLTKAEVNLMKKMQILQEQIESYKSSVNQIRLKFKYQEETDNIKKSEIEKPSNIVFDNKDLIHVQKVLKYQSEEIMSLVNMVNLLKQNLSLNIE